MCDTRDPPDDLALLEAIAATLREELGIPIEEQPGFHHPDEAGQVNRAFRAMTRSILRAGVSAGGDQPAALSDLLRRLARRRLEMGLLDAREVEHLLGLEFDGRDRSGMPPAPCVFCGRPIRHFDDGGTGWPLGTVVDGEPRSYLRCIEGPCYRASAPWIWRCGCSGRHVENVGGRCHRCRRPRGQAEPYDRVECPVCGAARWLDDRRGIGNGRCLSCTGGPAYLPVLFVALDATPLAILPGGTYGE